MDQTVNYADILTKIVREESRLQPSLQPIKIVASCDQETGQFLLIAFGWENSHWVHSILFHARLADGKIMIETDMTEEGLKPQLIQAGIPEENILSSLLPRRDDNERAAA
jgi:XisI protein